MIRALHAINWFRYGGVETQLLRTLRHYDRDRFQMDAACIGSGLGYLAEHGVGVQAVDGPQDPRLVEIA